MTSVKNDLEDGESFIVKGSGSNEYIIKRWGNVYSCPCLGWKKQSKSIELRTCKHLKAFRGEARELERIKDDSVPAPVTTSKPEPARRPRIKLYCGPREMLLPERLKDLDHANEWVAEEKKDGQWAVVDIVKGKITRIRSRVGLDQVGAESAGLLGLDLGVTHSGLLVGELTADLVGNEKCGTRRLHLFDVIEWGGHSLRDFPLWSVEKGVARRDMLELLFEHIKLTGTDRMHLVEQRTSGFTSWYHDVVAAGGEGLVLKRRDSIYNPLNADGKIDEWKRCKPKRTVDYVVMGHGVAAKGTPNIDVGLYKQTKDGRRLVKVGTVTTVSLDTPAAKLVGKVVELEGYEIFPSGIVRHAHLTRVRNDKLPIDCTYESAMAS